MFQRSASGPAGGLSINTSSANMFGSSSAQAPASGSLFGNTAQSTNTTAPKPGGLFGNTLSVPTSSQPQQTSSLFASTTTPASTTPAPRSLFGSTAPAQSQPAAPSSGLFGSSTAPAQTGGGLFGGGATNTAAAQPNTAPTGGLFGGLSTTTQPAQANTGGGVFGQSTQQQPSAFGGLGGTLGQSQQPQPSMSLGGIGLTMGQQNAQPSVPGVRIDVSNLKGTTRFNDLQEDLQKIIEKSDEFILAQISRKNEIDSFLPGHQQMLESIPEDVKFVTRKYDGARNALESAAQSIEAARLLVNQDADNARLSFRAIDNMKLPQQYHTSGFWSARQPSSSNANTETDGQDLVGFFSKTADEMAEQMKKYENNLTEIELHTHGVADTLNEQLARLMAAKNNGTTSSDEKIQELVAVLRDFEQGILRVAGDVGSVREGMTRLQLGDFMSHDRDSNGLY
ncbi:hypothetical protein GGR57DRAFT_179960 [Xylariaceae sp. FL1272]|nr:hypothetical protein GGR57DRAFT_179960 [Xylariaceae sp. FL1272]